jgi:transcriptional regulator with XRE-family HTH domain
MPTPRGDTEASRALALGALIRRLRRDRHLTLRELAERIPMSASNLSRIELGEQGPPPDEIIDRIAAALEVDRAELLRAAGRYTSGQTFEETVLSRLDSLGRDLRKLTGDLGEIKTTIGNTRKIR